jgi:uncharacterized repeat protein (TIGR03803 family)
MGHVQGTRRSRGVGTALILPLIALAVAGMAVSAQAQTYEVLYTFPGTPGGPNQASGALAQGRDGNLYGTSYFGGEYDKGTIYEMTTSGTLINVLYSFTTADRCGLGLTLGTDGNFYGACQRGGKYGYGYVFQVPPPPAINTLYDLYDFAGPPGDGANASGKPTEAADGNYYGTTLTGGTNNLGTVYRITPPAILGNPGTETIMYQFSNTENNAPNLNLSYPDGPLFLGIDGNLYGTTQASDLDFPLPLCPPSCGAVYRITTLGAFQVLHNFLGGKSDGATPTRGVIQGFDGNLYGTTERWGADKLGTIFKLNAKNDKVTPLYSFTSSDYGYPRLLAQAANGNFYGNTSGPNGCTMPCVVDGSLFGITRGGALEFTYDFAAYPGTGVIPDSALSNTNGYLYGVTEGIPQGGGTDIDSVLYRLSKSNDNNAVSSSASKVEPVTPEFCRPQISFGQESGTVKILGQGFNASSTVYFNGVPAKSTFMGSYFITATVPARAMTGPLTVTTTNPTTGKTTTIKSPQTFYVLPR